MRLDYKEVDLLKNIIIFIMFILSFSSYSCEEVDLIKIDKSDKKMYLMKEEKVIKTYEILIGKNPIGAKEKIGDKKTPEGNYILDYKNDRSFYYKSIHISYPSEDDKKNAIKNGWNPGGDITIHGENPDQEIEWTEGCIAVTNKEIDEIWRLVDIPTPIIIEP
jgi:murein L,D-transpeptidase YafK